MRGGPVTSRVLTGARMAQRVISTVQPDYAAGTALNQVVDGILAVLSSFQSSAGSVLTQYATYARNTLLAQYAIDQLGTSSTGPLSQLTAGATLANAINVLISQMNAASATIQAPTVTIGAQTAAMLSGSPSSNGTLLLSGKYVNGTVMNLLFPETLTFTCTKDSVSGGAVLGNETLTCTGQPLVSDVLSYLYPGGSGASKAFAAVVGTTNNSAGNLLYNSNFQTYSNTNVPDQFVVGAGVAGTTILNGAGTTYLTGGGSVEYVGDSSTLTGLTQSFGTTPSTSLGSGGTPATLAPDTVYHGCLFYKLSSASPAAGVLQVSLTDGSAYPGTVVNDDQGTANTATATLSSDADTNWHALTFVFRTPATPPTTAPTYKLRVRLSTALSTGTNVYVSNLTMTPAVQLYQAGPWASFHTGSNKLLAGLNPDTWTSAIANNYQTSGDGQLLAWLDRFWGLRALGVEPPSASSPSISDSSVIA